MPYLKEKRYNNPMVNYLDYAHDLRGRLINGVAEMEREIDDYIAKYFCHTKEKRAELMEVIVATKHLTFIAKADITKCLLIKSGDATVKEANKIHQHLSQTIAKQRNLIAHNSLDTSNGAINNFETDKQKTIYFLKYANVKTSEPFTKEDAITLLDLTFNIKQFFFGLNIRPKKIG